MSYTLLASRVVFTKKIREKALRLAKNKAIDDIRSHVERQWREGRVEVGSDGAYYIDCPFYMPKKGYVMRLEESEGRRPQLFVTDIGPKKVPITSRYSWLFRDLLVNVIFFIAASQLNLPG